MAKAKKISAKLLVVFILLVLLALVQITVIFWRLDHNGPSTSQPPASFNKKRHSIKDSSSIWAVVNKSRSLPASYAPSDLTVPKVALRLDSSDPQMSLRSVAAKNLEKIFQAAAKDSVKLRLASGYRSYSVQVAAYSSEVKGIGRAGADKESARAGYSEHQTGLAADIEPYDRSCEFSGCFADSAAGKWLAANAYKHGFILRYQRGKQDVTGYKYEPWHFRYVGNELASELQRSGKTMEQFFGLPAAPYYAETPFRLN